jgi:hypothetical protein
MKLRVLNLRDLNLAIPYAVQSGFRYPPGLCCQPLGANPYSRPFEPASGSQLRAFRAARHPHLGRFRARTLVGSGQYSKRFFAKANMLFWPNMRFCRGSMLNHHARLAATRARGTPLRSDRGGDSTSPAAANNVATGSASPAPNSTTITPSGASSAGAVAAIAR